MAKVQLVGIFFGVSSRILRVYMLDIVKRNPVQAPQVPSLSFRRFCPGRSFFPDGLNKCWAQQKLFSIWSLGTYGVYGLCCKKPLASLVEDRLCSACSLLIKHHKATLFGVGQHSEKAKRFWGLRCRTALALWLIGHLLVFNSSLYPVTRETKESP